MIGFYDYTVILTYLSLLSAVTGIGLAVARHPLLAILCLMFSGLCDMFDGRVARTKKNRTAEQKGFGIQIDSLCDIVAFGILPAVITIVVCGSVWYAVLIAALYVLAGLIRLAYFNVTEEERQSTGASKREFYTGLPVTSASLIFPTLVLLQRITRADLCWLYHAVMLATAGAFVGKFHVKKPNLRGILILVALGAAEFLLFLLLRLVTRHG